MTILTDHRQTETNQQLLTGLTRLGLTIGQFYSFNSRTGEYWLHKRFIHRPTEKPRVCKLKKDRQRRPMALSQYARLH